jgi:hypothetical protein
MLPRQRPNRGKEDRPGATNAQPARLSIRTTAHELLRRNDRRKRYVARLARIAPPQCPPARLPGGKYPGHAGAPFKPTASLLAAILRVSVAYIAVARAMSQAKRNAILAGYDNCSFVPLLNPPKTPLALPAPAKPVVDDVEIIDFVRNVGIGRVLDAAVAVEAAQ